MLTPTQLADAEAWLDQFSGVIADLDAGAIAAVLAAYAEVDDWENPTATLAAAAAAMAASTAARQAAAEVAAQFVSVIADIARGVSRTTSPPPMGYPRNADPFDVYSRPIFAYRDAVSEGRSEPEAQVIAFQRAEMIATTDNLLARRNAAVVQLERENISHYRRVIRPELSETGVCGICIAASVRVYKVSEFMPIHTRCKCEVVPILGADDVAERFNLADMRRLYEATPGTRKKDLVKTRYRVEDLPELGPVLIPIEKERVERIPA